MSRHEGVSCDSCLKSNFSGRRFKCLICFDYDLCADCYEEGVTSPRHLAEHPMQCILTRADYELYFGGETIGAEQPQSFTCPFCKKMGYTDATLLEHVSAEHTETSTEVVCPVCAGLPGGEPNLITDDFAGHLTLEHRTGPRELISFLDEPSAIRHGGGVRRIPGRSLGGPRARRNNMHFSSTGGLSALSPSGRESVDPIAELLSQLSGVRRSGPQSTQLQQLQMQIQLERQHVTATRQQLERLPRRAHQLVSTNSNATMAEVISGNSSLSASGLLSGVGSTGGNNGCARTMDWSLASGTSNHQQAAANASASALNPREVILNSSTSSSFMNVHEFGLSTNPFQQTGGASGNNGNNSVNNSAAAAAVAASAATAAVGNGAAASAAAAAGSAGNSSSAAADIAQAQVLITKFTQPALSASESAEQERLRTDRSQFVQSLLLSTMACPYIDEFADELQRRAEITMCSAFVKSNSGETSSERAAITAAAETETEQLATATTAATTNTTTTTETSTESSENLSGSNAASQDLIAHDNINVAAAAIETSTSSPAVAASFAINAAVAAAISENSNIANTVTTNQERHHQQQTQSHNNAAAKKKAAKQQQQANVAAAITDRGIERRGRPPPPPMGSAAASTANAAEVTQQQQAQPQQQHKLKQQAAVAGAATKATVNQIPDTR